MYQSKIQMLTQKFLQEFVSIYALIPEDMK